MTWIHADHLFASVYWVASEAEGWSEVVWWVHVSVWCVPGDAAGFEVADVISMVSEVEGVVAILIACEACSAVVASSEWFRIGLSGRFGRGVGGAWALRVPGLGVCCVVAFPEDCFHI